MYNVPQANRRPQSQRLQLQPQDENIRKMIAENKRAKLRKLAELFRAKRNITLAEKRQRKENTLALVKQFAAEARAKRAATEQPQVKKHVNFIMVIWMKKMMMSLYQMN